MYCIIKDHRDGRLFLDSEEDGIFIRAFESVIERDRSKRTLLGKYPDAKDVTKPSDTTSEVLRG